MKETFYSKVLLFGEYGIMQQGTGLSIPCKDYGGVLQKSSTSAKDKDKALASNLQLKRLIPHIEKLQSEGSLTEIDLNALHRDVKDGLYFDSEIPQGYGIGSSGALCAAIYNLYCLEEFKISSANPPLEQIQKLKKTFSKMERLFHGKSSGVDPLTCYLNRPLLIQNDDVESVCLPNFSEKKQGAVFLIDSGIQRKSEPLVHFFLEKYKKHSGPVTKVFMHHSHLAINSFLSGDAKCLFLSIREVSSFVLQNLRPMIPPQFIKLWKMGLETKSFYLKLCGAGGGGYILGFTPDWDRTRVLLNRFDTKLILTI